MQVEFLSKLKGRTLDELRVRAGQNAVAMLERARLTPDVRVPSDAAFRRRIRWSPLPRAESLADPMWEHFCTRDRPRFFAGFADKEATLDELRRRWPAGEAKVLAAADRICNGVFDLLGHKDLDFGTPIDWHFDPVARKHVPSVHWSRIDYLDAEMFGDHKVIWELNRQQYFVTLGKAYWYTGSERYARTFVDHVLSWMEANPPKQGVNWSSSLEIALRAISWSWALYFFRGAPALTAPVFWKILKFLYLHGRHIETYLSTYFSPNTHLTGEALGLFYLGSLFPELLSARRWRQQGWEILIEQLDRHVLQDGVYFERTTYYHRYTVDIYLHARILAMENGLEQAHAVDSHLKRLLDHSMYITKPDGRTPLFGDDDGGQLLALDHRDPDDFRPPLATGAAVFACPEYRFVAGGPAEETLWLLGPAGLKSCDALDDAQPTHLSRAFTAGGYYVMRDGWEHEANYMMIDCGTHGTRDCGHSHADELSFELAVRGRTVIVDPGTYTYSTSMAERDRFRSSAAHNTVTVDGESSSVPSGPFRWKESPRASAGAWIAEPTFDFFAGRQEGFRRLSSPVDHERSILFLKGTYWVVFDRARSRGSHTVEAHFHFVPGARLEVEPGRVDAELPGDPPDRVSLVAFGGPGQFREEAGWVSPCYGARERAPVATYSTQAAGDQEIVTFILPTLQRVPVIALPTPSGHAFALEVNPWRDLLLINACKTSEGPGVETDGNWAWLRLENGSTRVRKLLLLNGQRMAVAGVQLFQSAAAANYLWACWQRDVLTIRTDSTRFMVRPCGATRVLVNDRDIAVTPGQEWCRVRT